MLRDMGFLRLILALSVVIGHSDHSFGLPGLDTTLAVRSFYVISGFYMALVLSTKYRDKPYYVFVKSRYLRLFPLYFAVLVLTLAYGGVTWAVVGSVQWPLGGWANTLARLGDLPIACYALSNVFLFGQDVLSFFNVSENGRLVFDFLGRLSHTSFGGYMLVPQAWTLGLELAFYLVAPFFIAGPALAVLGVVLGSCLLRFVAFPAWGVDADAFGYRFFPFEIVFFCCGGLAYKLYARYRASGMGRLPHIVAVLALAPLFLSLGWNIPDPARYAALTLGIPSLFLLTRNSRHDRLVGELSYPVYISHMLVLYAITQYTRVGYELPGVLGTLALSMLLYLGVERRAEAWRGRVVAGTTRRFPSARGLAAVAVCVLVVVAAPLAGKAVLVREHLSQSAAIADYDFLQGNPEKMVLIGFDPPEENASGRWRWGLGEKSEILFSLPRAINFDLAFQFFPVADGQTVSVYCNDLLLETFRLDKDASVYRKYALPARKSGNVVRFVYGDWNGRAVRHVPQDARPLAVRFNTLAITF